MTVLPFSWMWRDPAEVVERKEEEIDPLLEEGRKRELRNKRRRIRQLVKAAQARKLKGQA